MIFQFNLKNDDNILLETMIYNIDPIEYIRSSNSKLEEH